MIIIDKKLLCFQIIDIIAKGAYGNVVKGRREDEKQFYAMKVRQKSHFALQVALRPPDKRAYIHPKDIIYIPLPQPLNASK